MTSNRDDTEREYEETTRDEQREPVLRPMLWGPDEGFAKLCLFDGAGRGIREDALELAVQLVRQVAATLDQREDACDHCGVKKYMNWPERQAAVELEAAATKIARILKAGVRCEKREKSA